MTYHPKNILITGAAGFIGCNFVHYLLGQYNDVKIVSLDKLTYAGCKDNLPNDPNHLFVHGDICDRDLVDKLLREHNIDTIVHFAAESHVDRSIEGPQVFVETNVMGTFTLLDAAKTFWIADKGWGEGECRFHHVSTDEVYGQLKADDPAFSEMTPYDPSSPYSASKAASDHFVRAYHRTFKLPCTISNCSNNYGPLQHDEKLIPTVIRACLAQKPIPVYGNGLNIRDWLYVEDHCSAIDTILQTGKVGETYNVGGKCERDNLTLIKTICAIIDKQRPKDKKHEELISFVEDRAGHDWRYAIDNTKIQTELGWQPKHQLESGLAKTVAYYTRH